MGSDGRLTVDLNVDCGEGFGIYPSGDDDALFRWVSSANIACGFHAGDPRTMRRTVRLAMKHGVAIGAHPGLPDLAGFGRREMALTPEEAADITLYQIGALEAFVKAEGGMLSHVKPHGALYTMLARDRLHSDAVALAIQRLDPDLILYGFAGGESIAAAESAGLRAASEAFADRTYSPDGSLAARHLPDAVITDPDRMARRAVDLATTGSTLDAGPAAAIRVDTLCIHGDCKAPAGAAQAIYERLAAHGIAVEPLCRQVKASPQLDRRC